MLRAQLEAVGRPIGAYDLLIAGQALRRNSTLVTANVSEFRRVEALVWQNWAKQGYAGNPTFYSLFPTFRLSFSFRDMLTDLVSQWILISLPDAVMLSMAE
jgi:hypothetical protein